MFSSDHKQLHISVIVLGYIFNFEMSCGDKERESGENAPFVRKK